MKPYTASSGACSGRSIIIVLLTLSAGSAMAAPPLRLDLSSGLNTVSDGLDGYLQNGFTTGAMLTQDFCNGASAGLGLTHTRYGHRSDLGTRIDSNRTHMEATGIRFTAGYGIRRWKAALKLYGRSGLSFLAAPEIEAVHPGTDIVINRLRAYNGAALDAGAGAELSLVPCPGIRLFVRYELAGLLNSGFTSETRDISGAVNAIGLIDPDLARDIPFTAEDRSLTTQNLGFGISVALGGSGTARAKDYNSSRSNTSSGTDFGRNPNSNADGGSSGTRAQDYNSSRSNNSSSIARPDGDSGSGNGSGQGDTRAQDYNSSRSNTTTAVGPGSETDKDSDGDDDSGPRGTDAQDYNSSRSNNINGEADPGGGNTGNGQGGTKAQDYNSSRSNTTMSAGTGKDVTDGDGSGSGPRGTDAQDYNSSRSNNINGEADLDDDTDTERQR